VLNAVFEQTVIVRYDVRVDIRHAMPTVPRQQVWLQHPKTGPSLSVQDSSEGNVKKQLNPCKTTGPVQVMGILFWLRREQLTGERSVDHRVPLDDRTQDLKIDGGYRDG
jgi:hypothetical protein